MKKIFPLLAASSLIISAALFGQTDPNTTPTDTTRSHFGTHFGKSMQRVFSFQEKCGSMKKLCNDSQNISLDFYELQNENQNLDPSNPAQIAQLQYMNITFQIECIANRITAGGDTSTLDNNLFRLSSSNIFQDALYWYPDGSDSRTLFMYLNNYATDAINTLAIAASLTSDEKRELNVLLDKKPQIDSNNQPALSEFQLVSFEYLEFIIAKRNRDPQPKDANSNGLDPKDLHSKLSGIQKHLSTLNVNSIDDLNAFQLDLIPTDFYFQRQLPPSAQQEPSSEPSNN